jgi:hypothetical protein
MEVHRLINDLQAAFRRREISVADLVDRIGPLEREPRYLFVQFEETFRDTAPTR